MKKILLALLLASTQSKRLSVSQKDDDIGFAPENENEEGGAYDAQDGSSLLRKEYKETKSVELQKLEKEKAKILADLAKAKKDAKDKARDALEDPSGFRKLQKKLEDERLANGFLNEVEQAEYDAAQLV